MKIYDLLRVCFQNLSRHKARTLLTVLGVIVGCCSVVIMISIGIGMKEAQEQALSQMGDLKIISVYPAGKGSGAAVLNSKAIGAVKGIHGVEAAMPRLTAGSLPLSIFAGRDRRYRGTYVTVVGIDLKAAEIMGYQLTEGEWSRPGKGCVWAGQNLAYTFQDTKRPEGRDTVDMYGGEADENGMPVMPSPYFDVMKTPMTMELESGKEDGRKISLPLTAAGRMKEDYGKGEETSMGLVMELGELQRLMEQQARLAGQKAVRNRGYSNALVKVKDITDVAGAEKEIRKMGFRTSSMESIRKPMEREARQKQMMLGGLGGISLFVAALGITNTMIMSISERTREIGVMKSLGCFVKDIRRIFLLEAGCIGLLGGLAGIVLSAGISLVMNLAAQSSGSAVDAMMPMGEAMASPARLSVIPWWLAVFAVFFSVAIGVGAGYYPASRAVAIPALEAIKHD